MKTVKRSIAIAALSIACLGGVTACGSSDASETSDSSDSSDSSETPYDVETYEVTLADGRTVTCVEVDNVRSGGLSCDWANAK